MIETFLGQYLTFGLGAVGLAGAAFLWFKVPFLGKELALALVGTSLYFFGWSGGFAEATDLGKTNQLREQNQKLAEHIKNLGEAQAKMLELGRQNQRLAIMAKAEADERKGQADEILSTFEKPAPACEWSPAERRRVQSIRVGGKRSTAAPAAGQ